MLTSEVVLDVLFCLYVADFVVHETECHLRDLEHVTASRLLLSASVRRPESRRKDDDQHHQRELDLAQRIKTFPTLGIKNGPVGNG